jgi:hypothetical protein
MDLDAWLKRQVLEVWEVVPQGTADFVLNAEQLQAIAE